MATSSVIIVLQHTVSRAELEALVDHVTLHGGDVRHRYFLGKFKGFSATVPSGLRAELQAAIGAPGNIVEYIESDSEVQTYSIMRNIF